MTVIAKKVYEVSFLVAGKLGSSFSNAFTSASAKADQLKSRTHGLQRSLRDLEKQHRKGTISNDQYTASYQRLSRELNQTIHQTKRLESAQRRQQQFQRGISAGASSLAAAVAFPVAGAGLAGGLLAKNTLSKAMGFESQLSSIKAVTGLAASEMEKMRELSLKTGAETKYNALEAAQGIEALIKAGISPAVVQAGGLQSALSLATAGGLELAESADLMADGLNGFSRDGMTAAEVANILAGAANSSSTNVRDLGMGIAQVGAVATGVGVSFKEVNATLGAFSNNALKSSDAGTSLKTFLQNVQPDTKESISLFKKFGLTLKDGSNIFFDANGQLKDMADVAEILQTKFKDLTDQQRSEAFFQLFGTDAVRAANILYKEGSEGIEKMYKEMGKVTALQVAEEKMNNAAGAVEQLSGAFETLQIVAAEGSLPFIKTIATQAADLLEGNVGAAERAGKRFGNALEEIFTPLTATKPEFQKELKHNPEYLARYRAEMEKWKEFKDMDFSDRFIESLDIMADKVDAWVDGPGGEKMGQIFSKLAEIAVNAWWNTLSSTINAATSQAMNGNMASAAGLALVANMMTGGAVVKGAKGALKGGAKVAGAGWKKGKDVLSKKGGPPPSTPKKGSKTQEKVRSRKEMAAAKQMEATATKTSSSSGKLKGASSVLQKAGDALKKSSGVVKKAFSKSLLPLGVVMEGLKIFNSKDKTKQTAKSAGGLAAGAAGAAGGAALGTAIFPGAGTVIGGFLGGTAGYLGGDWLGGKIVDFFRGDSKKSAAPQAAQAVSQQGGVNGSIDLAPLQAKIQLATKNAEILTMHLGRASGQVVGAFYPLQGEGARLATNIRSLVYWTGISSAKVVGVFGPLETNGKLLSHNLQTLTYWTGLSSAKVVGAFGTMDEKGRLVSHNLSVLTYWVGMASGKVVSAFQPIAEKGALVSNNLSTLTYWTGMGSVWMSSLAPIQTAAQGVKSALDSLTSRINSTSVSGGGGAKASGKSTKKYARGTIVNQPHVGMVGEAGTESIIPWKRNARSISLLQQTSNALGFNLAEKSRGLNAPSSNIVVNYNPVIQGGNTEEINSILKKDKENLVDVLKGIRHQEMRVSYGG